MGYAQDLVSRGFYGYQGWGDPEAEADFRATGGAGKGGPTSTSSGAGSSLPSVSGFDPVATARSIQQFQTQANQPAIQTLEAQKQPLQERYKSLLDSIVGKEQLATKQTEVAASREFAQRGLPLSSDAFTQFLQERTSPITTQFAGLKSETEAGRSQDLFNLAQSIASLQAGSPNQSFQTALSLIGLQQKAEEIAGQNQYLSLGEGQTLFDPRTGKPIYTAPKTYKPEESTDLSALAALFGGGLNTPAPTEPKPTYKPGGSTKPSSAGNLSKAFASLGLNI